MKRITIRRHWKVTKSRQKPERLSSEQTLRTKGKNHEFVSFCWWWSQHPLATPVTEKISVTASRTESGKAGNWGGKSLQWKSLTKVRGKSWAQSLLVSWPTSKQASAAESPTGWPEGGVWEGSASQRTEPHVMSVNTLHASPSTREAHAEVGWSLPGWRCTRTQVWWAEKWGVGRETWSREQTVWAWAPAGTAQARGLQMAQGDPRTSGLGRSSRGTKAWGRAPALAGEMHKYSVSPGKPVPTGAGRQWSSDKQQIQRSCSILSTPYSCFFFKLKYSWFTMC